MGALLKSFEIGIEEIKFDLKNVVVNMGYRDISIPEEMKSVVEGLYIEAKDYVDISCGYVVLEGVNTLVKNGKIYLNEIIFDTGKIVGYPLKKMSEAVLFVGTIGPRFDSWSKSFFERGDALEGYIADLIGSELGEGTADLVENIIVKESKINDLNCSNRYSPGYCGWSVADQHKLFSFLPKGFCGITLTDAGLMKPHKSVSGIIGRGKNIDRMEYICDVCNATHCYKNKPGKK